MTHRLHNSKLLALALAACSITGCRVGPKYVGAPPTPAALAYKEATPQAYTGAQDGTWKPAQPQDALLKGKWWEIFHEPELNTLEDSLNIDNQNIATFFQNFIAARYQVKQARAAYYPTLSVAPSFTREKSASTLRGVGTSSSAGGTGTTTGTTTGTSSGGSVSTTSNGGTFTELSLPFDVSWEPDLWGRVRNTVREFQYAAQVSAADLENEKLTEQASLAQFYFELRGQDALKEVLDRTVEADRKSLELTRALVETGIDSPEATAQAEVTLQNAEELAIGVATNRAIFEHAIATLIGKPASSFSIPVKSLTTTVPAIPIGVPSQLLQRRPDIAAAERTMAEANALIGVEKAAYYPNLSLTGSGGNESSSIGSLFSVPGFFWTLGSSASETIFDANLRKNTVAQFTALYNADVATYRQTVLTAFQQVEDFIATVRVTSDQLIKQDQAVASAQRFVDIATARYQTGLDPYLDVITAQTTLLADQQTQVTLRVSEMTAAVQLIQALGGGWELNNLPPAGTITTDGAARQVSATP